MAALALKLTGVTEAQQYLTRVREGCEEVSRFGWKVGSALPYAYGIETGRHPRGRLARRAGGAYYLRDAVPEVEGGHRGGLVAALPRGAQSVAAFLLGLPRALVRAAQRRAPERRGDLRRSIYAVRTGRAG